MEVVGPAVKAPAPLPEKRLMAPDARAKSMPKASRERLVAARDRSQPSGPLTLLRALPASYTTARSSSREHIARSFIWSADWSAAQGHCSCVPGLQVQHPDCTQHENVPQYRWLSLTQSAGGGNYWP